MKIALLKINWLNPKQAVIGLFSWSKICHAGLTNDIPGEFLRWDKAGTVRNKGLTNRRICEGGLFQMPMEMIYG